MGQNIPETPGPSRYQTNISSIKVKPKNKNATVNSFSSGERFSSSGGLGVSGVGPGVYDTSSSWVKKSYNVTYVSKK
jgi:hypothetical protein